MMQYYSALKINELSGHEKACIKHTYTLLSEKKKSGKPSYYIVAAQSLSHVWFFVSPWNAACQASLSFTMSQSLLKFMSIELVMLSNHLILCHPLLFLPSIYPSIRVFCNEWTLRIRWPKYWSFSFSISPSNEYSGLMSFRMDWFDLFAIQGTLKRLLQHSAFFMVQLSYQYMTAGKTIALTRWIYVIKVMSLLFNTLSMFIVAFLPRNKCLLISWLQSPSIVISELKKIKSATIFIFYQSICHEVMGLDAVILVFSKLSFKFLFYLSLQ